MSTEGKKGRAQDHVTPNILGIKCQQLNANSSKMAKDTNFKFGRHRPRQIIL